MSTEATVDPQNADATSTTAGQQTSAATDQKATSSTDATAQAGKPAGQSGTSDAERAAKGQLEDLKKERQARQQYEKQSREQAAQLQLLQRQIQALTGAAPKGQEDAEADAIKQQFFKYFPQYQKLDEKTIDKLLQATDRIGSLDALEQHVWGKHGQSMIDSVETEIAKAFDSETLNAQQQEIVLALYRQRAESDPEFLTRHERGDKTLIKEFAAQFVESVFEPARRKAQAQAVSSQRPVPNGGQRSILGAGGKKVDLSNNDAFGAAMAAEFKANGGRFDG